MSRFSKYAQKVDEIAKSAFEEYHRAEKTLKEAEEKARQYPQQQGAISAEYTAKSAYAQAELIKAREAMKAAKRVFESRQSELEEARKELAADIEASYRADPAKLDTAALELMKSGIMNASDYEKLLNEALAAENHTMVKLIGKYAEDAAAAVSEKYGQHDDEARILRIVSAESRKNSTGSEYLEAFDAMADLFGRCVRNPRMIDSWEEFTAGIVEAF